MPARPLASKKRFFLPSDSDWCTCPLQPGRCLFHFAMKLGMIPYDAPISFAPLLNSTPRSAHSRASENCSAASYTPGPVSVCSPSIGTRNSSILSISALKYSRLAFERSSE